MFPNNQSSANKVIQAQLLPGEELLWVGRPKQGFALRALDLWILPFMLCWFTFALWGVFAIYEQEGSFRSLVFTVPLAFVGMLFFVARYFVDALFRAKTY